MNWTLREDGKEFDSADIPLADGFMPKTTGERRTLVEQYYHSLNFTSVVDARKFLRVCEGVLNRIDRLIEPPTEWNECHRAGKERLLQCLTGSSAGNVPFARACASKVV